VDAALLGAVISTMLHHCSVSDPFLAALEPAPQLELELDVALLQLLRLCEKCKEQLSDEEQVALEIPLHIASVLVRHFSQQSKRPDQSPGAGVVLKEAPQMRRLDTSSASSINSSSDGSAVGAAGCSSVVRLAVQRTELEILLGGFLDDTWETIHSAVEEYRRSDHTASEGGGTVAIDEVVLVGGCSLLPCVRSAIREALVEEGVNTFGGRDAGPTHSCSSSPAKEDEQEEGGVRDFCSSVNPHESVAHGLAVKGALMMGVREGRLKELLMIDSVPYAVGILSFQPSLEQGEDKDEWEFEPILERGMRLPCTQRKTFSLDASSLRARQVSIDVYEESFEGNSVDSEVKFISNCDLPIGHLRVCASGDSGRASSGCDDDGKPPTVDVVFHMLESGEVKFSVEDSAGQGQGECEGDDSAGASTLVLGLYILCLLLLYVVVKVVIVGNSELMQDLQARELDDGEASDMYSLSAEGGGVSGFAETQGPQLGSDHPINSEFEF